MRKATNNSRHSTKKMTKAEKIITVFTLLLLILTIGWFLSDKNEVSFIIRPLPSPVDESAGKLNINTANKEELDTLPGVGPALAERILDYINTEGPIDGPEELIQIYGIGEATAAGLEDYICYREELP